MQATIQTQFKAALIGGGKVKLTKKLLTHTHTSSQKEEETQSQALKEQARHTGGRGAEKEHRRAAGGGGKRSQLNKAWLFVETLAAKMVMQARYERRHRPGRVPTIKLEWCLQE